MVGRLRATEPIHRRSRCRSSSSSCAVADFAKKTGDYSALSSTDVKLIALTYQLHCETASGSSLREVPAVMVRL